MVNRVVVGADTSLSGQPPSTSSMPPTFRHVHRPPHADDSANQALGHYKTCSSALISSCVGRETRAAGMGRANPFDRYHLDLRLALIALGRPPSDSTDESPAGIFGDFTRPMASGKVSQSHADGRASAYRWSTVSMGYADAGETWWRCIDPPRLHQVPDKALKIKALFFFRPGEFEVVHTSEPQLCAIPRTCIRAATGSTTSARARRSPCANAGALILSHALT